MKIRRSAVLCILSLVLCVTAILGERGTEDGEERAVAAAVTESEQTTSASRG